MKPTAELETFEAFRGLSDTGRAVLGRGLRCATYPATAPVLRKGQRVSGAYMVLRGRLRVFTLAPDGDEATLYLIHPGETCVLALNCIFNDLLYPAWVQADPATAVAVIPGPAYKTLFDIEPAVRNATVQAFSTLVFRLMAELEQRHAYKLEQRLASFLLQHAGVDGVVRMTQQQIASHLGTTREGVTRLLRRMAADGRVETGRGRITAQPARLAALLNRTGPTSPAGTAPVRKRKPAVRA